LTDVTLLAEPLSLGDIGDGVTVTHRGYLRFLPRNLALCYYYAAACANLISLDYIQERGDAFASVGRTQLSIVDCDGAVLDLVTKGSNRLCAVSHLRYGSSLSLVAIAAVSSTSADFSTMTPIYDDLISVLLCCESQEWILADTLANSPLFAFSLRSVASRFEHYSAEQRDRCDRVQVLHSFIHIGDDALCQALDGGAYAWANVTSTDVSLNRRLRGPCIQCMEGKFERKSMPTSHTPPAVAVGDMLSIDTNMLTVKSPGGNLCYIDSIDVFSGDRQVTPCKSLYSADIFNAVMTLVHTRYNAYGHRVQHILADSLPAFQPVIAMLGAVRILLTLVASGQHAQRVERSIGSSDVWRRAVLASLPSVLPMQYELYLLIWIADVANGAPNVHGHPTVPDVLVSGRRRVEHYKYPEMRFGQTCMVQVALEKRFPLPYLFNQFCLCCLLLLPRVLQ